MLTRSSAVATVLAACALSALAAGCGGGSDQDDIQRLVDDFSSGLLDSDGDQVCKLLTADARKEFPRAESQDECVKLVDGIAKPDAEASKRFEDPKVSDLEVDGDTATATVKTSGGEGVTQFRKADGHWLIDA